MLLLWSAGMNHFAGPLCAPSPHLEFESAAAVKVIRCRLRLLGDALRGEWEAKLAKSEASGEAALAGRGRRFGWRRKRLGALALLLAQLPPPFSSSTTALSFFPTRAAGVEKPCTLC